MKNKDEQQRITYPKSFKRQALIELAGGDSPVKILKKSKYNIKNQLQSDKKYPSKLLHKWRKELYDNNELIHFLNQDLTNDALKKEIEMLQEQESDDYVMEEMGVKLKHSIRFLLMMMNKRIEARNKSKKNT